MSSYTIAWAESASILDLWPELAAAGLPVSGVEQGPGSLTVSFTGTLTAEQRATAQDIANDLAVLARSGVKLSLAEWRAIKADIAGLKAYLGVASPTAAQTAAATKAIIRVLGTIIRE